MKIVIITSSRTGTASYCLPVILAKGNCEVVKVVLSQNIRKKKWPFYKKKFKKILRIGILGAINGIRIRDWFKSSRVGNVILQDIEVFCKENNIPFDITPSLNSKRTIDVLNSCQPDVAVSLGNSYISPKIFSIPRYGMLNIHGEVLPDFQNAQSVIWQLFEGRSETGYTIHKIDKGIDTGDILLQEKFPIVFKESLSETVRYNCGVILHRSAEGLVSVLNNFTHYLQQGYKQGKGNSYTTPTFWQFLKIKKQYKKLSALSRNTK
jgi:methionyl-tRNA formyltransferase